MLISFLVVDIFCFFPPSIPPLYLANFVHSECAEPLFALASFVARNGKVTASSGHKANNDNVGMDASGALFFHCVSVLTLIYCLEL